MDLISILFQFLDLNVTRPVAHSPPGKWGTEFIQYIVKRRGASKKKSRLIHNGSPIGGIPPLAPPEVGL